MRGKTEAAIAYGFKSDINFKYDPKNPGYDYCVTGYPGQPVYCGIVLKSKSITKAMDEIKKVDVSIIAKFDEFAKKHNEIPTWQVVVTGELELELYDEEED